MKGGILQLLALIDMKKEHNQILYLALISLLLTIVGFIFWKTIVDMYVILIKYEYKGFTTTGAWYFPRIKTALLLGLMPWILRLSWQYGQIKKSSYKMTSILIMVFSIFITGFLRVRNLKPPDIKEIQEQFIPDFSSLDFISAEEMKIWLFLMIGLGIGFLINVIGFRLIKSSR